MSSNTLTYEADSPTRPTVDDMGGAAWENHPKYPPTPTVHPTAEDLNQVVKQIAAAHRVVPLASFGVRFSAGAPIIEFFTSVRTDVTSGDITVTDNGTGDVSLTWAAGTFPAASLPPRSGCYGATSGRATAEAITNGVRVRVLNASDAAADLSFWVDVS